MMMKLTLVVLIEKMRIKVVYLLELMVMILINLRILQKPYYHQVELLTEQENHLRIKLVVKMAL